MLDVLPEKPLEPVNDLGTRLHGELFPVTHFQLVDLRVARLDPGCLVVHVDLLLLVHYIAAHHLRQLQFVGTGPVGVQHHLPVGEDLLPNGHPVSLADWPGSRGPPARAGLSLKRRKDCRRPRSTMPAHCSHFNT